MKKIFLTGNPSATKILAAALAKGINRRKIGDRAFIIGLEGDLGGGKTSFLQGFAKGLGIKEKILSPTFVIMKKFIIPAQKTRFFKFFYHFDCYRMGTEKDVLELGFKEIISDPENIIAIEWAEKIKKTLPPKTLWINFKFINDKKRKITILK